MKYIFSILLLLLLFSSIYCGLCGINPPEDRSYCGNYLALNGTHRCSYCKDESTEKYYCLIQVNNSKIAGFDCQSYDDIIVNEDLPGSPCLNHKEIKNTPVDEITEEFCHSHSVDEKHPCCYYNDGVNKKCFSIGKITSTTLYTYNEFLNCFSTHINTKFIWFFILLFFIFDI